MIKDTQLAAKTIAENLAHVVTLGKQASSQEKKPDILLFHEFTLTDYFYGDRDSKQKVTITIPGPETHAFGVLANECNAYVVFSV